MQLTSCPNDADAVEDDTVNVVQDCRADSESCVYPEVEGQVAIFVCLVIVLCREGGQFLPPAILPEVTYL